jgi:hypothetical protein
MAQIQVARCIADRSRYLSGSHTRLSLNEIAAHCTPKPSDPPTTSRLKAHANLAWGEALGLQPNQSQAGCRGWWKSSCVYFSGGSVVLQPHEKGSNSMGFSPGFSFLKHKPLFSILCRPALKCRGNPTKLPKPSPITDLGAVRREISSYRSKSPDAADRVAPYSSIPA